MHLYAIFFSTIFCRSQYDTTLVNVISWHLLALFIVIYFVFLARDVIYTSRAYATMSVSVCLSICMSVTEVHCRIIANLGFEFRSQFTTHCGRGACVREQWTIYSSVGAREGIIAGKSGEIISHYASHCKALLLVILTDRHGPKHYRCQSLLGQVTEYIWWYWWCTCWCQ